MLNFQTKHHAGLRKSTRKDLQYPAWVDAGDGSSPVSCTMLDVSRTGARLAIENSNDIPAEFTLLLTGTGAVRRKCRVMRRSNGEIGVQFVNGSPPRDAAPDA
jgi:hypothetical protein